MNLSFRFAGRAAIASGVAGILAFVFLIAFLSVRSENMETGLFVLRLHDAGVILQFLLLIPVASALFRLTMQRYPGSSGAMLNIGIGALSFTALFLLLIFPKILGDSVYMFPQGIFGLWLIVICWRLKGIFAQWLRWFGIVVGLGLTLVGTFPVGYALFVDKSILQIPAVPVEVIEKIPIDTPANILLHQILQVGSFMGVLTLPIWTILAGIILLRKKTNDF